MAEEQEKSFLRQVLDFPSRNMENPPSLGGQFEAIAREGLKDLRSKTNEVFFGAPDGPGEPGTPMVPTQMAVNNELGIKADYNAMLDGYASAAAPPDRSQDLGR